MQLFNLLTGVVTKYCYLKYYLDLCVKYYFDLDA